MATDELTGLANREHFRTMVERKIAALQALDAKFAVMLMDLDRFKEVNAVLGYDYGDLLLRTLGLRLAAGVGPDKLVARLGGDEFAFLLGLHSDDPAELETFASNLLESVRQPIVVDEVSLELGGSVGIALFPSDGRDAHTLLRRAELAMYAAKAHQSGWRLYSPDLDQQSAQRLAVLNDFRRALLSGEIVVNYQPIVDLREGLVVRAAGAVVCWEHPEKGRLPPDVFMPAVEQTGLIGSVTDHVLDRAIAQCAEWRRGGNQMSVAVNVPARNLLHGEFPREVEWLLSLHSLAPDALRLEIDMTTPMPDPEPAIATAMRLTGLGVHFSLDGFGTDYSSLAALRQLPIDELKIDRSFVTPMLNDQSDLAIVRSTIDLGKCLGLRIVAEGVEDERTLVRLSQLACDRAQGNWIGKPMPPGALDEWLAGNPSPREA